MSIHEGRMVPWWLVVGVIPSSIRVITSVNYRATCWIQGPERRSAIASGLSVALCGDQLRIPRTEVISGQNISQQQREEAAEERLHPYLHVESPRWSDRCSLFVPDGPAAV